MKSFIPLALGMLLLSGSVSAQPATDMIGRGRYLIEIGGCNDCHTPGYSQSRGKIGEQQWLLGSDVGFAGPWGVSYASNLRLSADAMTLQQWQQRIQTGGLPPMPWPAMQAMTTEDQTAVFEFIKSLGREGLPTPAALPPGAPIKTPYLTMVPQVPVNP